MLILEVNNITDKEERAHYSVNDMYNFAKEILIKGEYPEKSAEATAFALLEADKRGIFSHGIAGGIGLEEAVTWAGITSTVDPTAELVIEDQKYPTLAVINANGAPGHISAMMAVELVKKMAREYGFGKVIVNNANHFGAAGVWSELIAEDGDLKGTVSCTTVACGRVMGDDVDRIDYTKGAGKEVRLGTNPIAISVPTRRGILTMDMAMTRMAVSYCLKHLKAGKQMSIPEYMADKNYISTLDPTDFAESMEKLKSNAIIGTVFPLGSTLAGYKGDIMLRMLEIDQALGGGPVTKIPFSGNSKERRISLSFEAQSIDFYYDLAGTKNRVDDLMHDYESKYFGPSSRWPGDRSLEATKYCLEEGIPYSEGQINTLRRAANHVNLDFDEILKSLGRKEYPIYIFNK